MNAASAEAVAGKRRAHGFAREMGVLESVGPYVRDPDTAQKLTQVCTPAPCSSFVPVLSFYNLDLTIILTYPCEGSVGRILLSCASYGITGK